jgi:hypothetical protein
MNAFRKVGILAPLFGLFALGVLKLGSDVDAYSPGMAADSGIECGSPCSADMSKLAYPLGDGLVVLPLDHFF